MSETTYTIENAKSNRASCKKCKAKIEKNELRIGTHAPGPGDFNMTSWRHPACFALPRKQGDVESFVADILRDDTEERILSDPAKANEIIEQIKQKAPTSASKDGAALSGNQLVDMVQSLLGKAHQEDTDPPAKKAKTIEGQQIDIVRRYAKSTATHLKDILKWNRQIQTGTKDVLLGKTIDGVMYGRLARCQLCTGRLKLSEANKVVCNGKYDEENAIRLPCAFECAPDKAPRWQPFYEDEPTEKEMETMDKLEEEATEGGPKVAEGDLEIVLKKAAKLEWKIDSKADLRKSVNSLTVLLADCGVNLPDSKAEATMKIGKMVLPIKDEALDDIVTSLVKDLGFTKDAAAAEEKKKEATEASVHCPENASLVAAFHELAQLYFKEGNRNAGAVYNKVVAALQKLPYPVTEDNALGLGKGKTKVENIGKGSAEKIYEYVTTGTLTKLEQKRQEQA